MVSSVLEEHWLSIELSCSFNAFLGVIFYVVGLLVRFPFNPKFLHRLLVKERNGATGVQQYLDLVFLFPYV